MKDEKNELIPFKRYYKSLNKEQKTEFLNKVEACISRSNFHLSVKKNNFTPLQIFFLESITNKSFNWDK